MDDQARVTTYGNLNLPQGTEEHPLVTFAVFAYNQEKYIREAIQGAFSQTYSPLEIILSDDCSSDRTFQIMQEMAATYEGPHCLKTRKSKCNAGTLTHLLQTAQECSGKYFVVAAGDDISLPTRTSTLAAFFQEDNYAAISSASKIFTDNVEDGVYHSLSSVTRFDNIFAASELSRIHGATAAYRTSILQSLPTPDTHVLSEDFTLEILLHTLSKKVGLLPDPLILYRVHNQNIGSSKHAGRTVHDIEKSEIGLCRTKALGAASLDYVDKALRHLTQERSHDIRNPIKTDILHRKVTYLKKRAIWYDIGIMRRLFLIKDFFEFDSTRGFFPRVLGLRAYAIISSAQNRLTRAYKGRIPS
jgi:glycosyltransferase involved in cell wall biosynthesis